MKKYVFLISIMFLFSVSTFAQTPNFAGEWTLDRDKTKFDPKQPNVIESQTLTVEQTEKEIKAKIATKGPGGANSVDVGGGTLTYTLDGKEVTIQRDTQIGAMQIISKGEIKDGQLHLQTTRILNTAMGEVRLKTKETWSLGTDGKTLKIKKDSESPNQTTSSELIYSKK